LRSWLWAIGLVLALSGVAWAILRSGHRRHLDPAGGLAQTGATIPLRPELDGNEHLTVALNAQDLAQAFRLYAALTGRQLLSATNTVAERVDDWLSSRLVRLHLVPVSPSEVATPDLTFHHDGLFTTGQLKEMLERIFWTNGLTLAPVGQKYFRAAEVHPSGATNR